MTPETRTCKNCKNPFTIEPADFAFYDKIQVPAPTWCPECRMVRRFLFRNEHFLFRNKDEVTKQEIFSGIPPHAPYKIYNHDYWWSDGWDAVMYGRDYDFSRPFFQQFKELLRAVPWCAKTATEVTNSEYSDQASYLKNTYLCFDVDHVENAAYLVNSGYSKDSYDLLSSLHDELCYENVMVNNSYRVFFSYNCDGCHNVWFSKNCVGCNDCFGCANLRGKKYHLFNRPLAKDAYEEQLRQLHLASAASLEKRKRQAHEFWRGFPEKCFHGLRNVNSSGDYLNDAKNARHCFIVQGAENVKYLQMVFYKSSDSYDYTVWGDAASRMYECVTCGLQCDSLKFCFDSWPSSQNLEYCISCRSSSNLFGCVGLKKKNYCILNKAYTKAEYDALRDKIMRHMSEVPYTDRRGHAYAYGEFFPPEFSPFAYNETLAHDFFPLTKAQALQKGFSWHDPENREYDNTMRSDELPDTIADVSDPILNEVIGCGTCKKAYRIIETELGFYRRMNLPLPRQCVECRLRARFAYLNSPRFYTRACQCAGVRSKSGTYQNTAAHFHGADSCHNEFETSYAPDRPEIVYCESCYNAEVA